ncbi:MAG: HAD family hydrolase [Verrucomicrobiota bacterium]|nr:HAD family hydrolase [Verrucomicrobiota bacterium]
MVLLDRDGTLIVDKDYLADPAGVELLPGAIAGLKHWKAAGYRIALVTNQSGIARGYFTHDTLARIHQRLIDLLASEGVALDGIYYCPHGPQDHCDCRKPLPGLALQAATELNGDLTRSIVIGDKPADISLARAIGAKAILVLTGYGLLYDFVKEPQPDYIADSLEVAAEWVSMHILRG